ncbi:MAG: hypothetical protein AB1716_19100, partial [Planctomycetota bacterium]
MSRLVTERLPMKPHRLLPLLAPVFAVLLASVGLSSAQEPPPAASEDNLGPLQQKADVTPDDQEMIRGYVVKRVGLIVGEEAGAAQQGADELRKAYDGGDAFKRAYVAVCLDVFGNAVRKADLAPASRMLAIVNTFNSPDAVPLLIEALQDERVAVQAAGAVGLSALREKLAAAGRDPYVRAVTALKDAGKRARSREALRCIYTALDCSALANAPDPKANAAAVLEVLDERAKQYAGGELYGAGAEDAGLRVAAALAQHLDDAQRKQLTTVTATLMKRALVEYLHGQLIRVRDKTGTPEQIELRNGMERLVIEAEKLLTNQLKPQTGPAVAEAMRKANATEMAKEWKKWVPVLQRETGQDFALDEAKTAAAAAEAMRKPRAKKDKDKE